MELIQQIERIYTGNALKAHINGEMFEKAVIDVLKENRYHQLNRDENKKYINTGSFHHLQDGFYCIRHPYGSHKFPDIMLIHVKNGFVKILYVECKTGNNCINWNDGFPRKDCLYAFMCHKTKKTIIFTYVDLVNKSIEKVHDESKKVNQENNIKMRNALKGVGWYPTIRHAWTQRGIDKIDRNISIVVSRVNSFQSGLFTLYKRGISLFSGAGGDTLGMEMAGVKVIGYVEKNKDAIKTHTENFKNSVLIGNGNIQKISDDEFKQYQGKVEFLFGGFPCQSFSHGGKKDSKDPRGQLYKDFVRATDCIKPEWVIGENVRGILSRKNDEDKFMSDVVVEEFKKIGYHMVYRLINTKDYGLPQDRNRVIFVGTRRNIKIDIPSGNNTSSTLRDIVESTLDSAIEITDKNKHLLDIDEKKFIKCNCEKEGTPPTNLKKLADRKTANDMITFDKRSKSTYGALVDVDKVSRTLLCTYARMPRLFIPMHHVKTGKKYMRPYTLNECKHIQGMQKISFNCSRNKAINQIGNAIPPVVVFEIVKYLCNFK